MSDASSNSVTNWIKELKSGDGEAARQLWNRYFQRLVEVAGRKLGGAARRMADEEDVALSVLQALCEGAAAGRFEQLENREDLWSLLVAITSKKAIDQVRRQTSRKRGAGEVRGNSIFATADGDAGFEQVIAEQPTPEFIALMSEEHSRLLDMLRDEAQREIVRYRLAGYSNEEIASKVGISLRSVERKLNVIRDAWSKELHG